MKVGRREFIRLTTLSLSAGVVAACSQPTATPAPTEAPTSTPEPTTASGVSEATATLEPTAVPTSLYVESPYLSERVASGVLPAIEDRLPEEPLVCPTPFGLGNVGGNIRRAFNGVSDRWGVRKIAGVGLVFYNADMTLRPEIIESWSYSDDATELTLYLRKGQKWSDGEPFTSEDFRYFFEDCALVDETILAGDAAFLKTGADSVLPEFSVPDEYTVVYKFADPNPLYIPTATLRQPYSPAHYMKQFHGSFAKEADLDAMVAEAGFETWQQLYMAQDQWWTNADRPTQYPFISFNTMAQELYILERNPYFYEVDTNGVQLPYVDTMTHRLFESVDTMNMWVMNGEIDYQARHMDIANFTPFKEGEETGDFKVAAVAGTKHVCLLPNLTTKNERLRTFFNTLDVRKAMSLAIDRDTMNELAFDGLATPRQYSPLPTSPNYDPDLSSNYVDYDVDQANRLLDEAGYNERDAEGYRVYPDGSGDTIFFSIEGYLDQGSSWEDCANLTTNYLGEVGIKCVYKYSERSLVEEHFAANDTDACFPSWNAWTLLPIQEMTVFDGTRQDHAWAGAWALYSIDPTDPNAEEPPADHWIWDIWNIRDQIKVTSSEEGQNELFQGILDIWREQLLMVGMLGELPSILIVKNGLGGYSEDITIDSGSTKDESICPIQTLFWDDPDSHVL